MEDLSHLLPPAAVVAQSSMSATNTVSQQDGSMTAPGSASEQTVAVPARPPMFEVPPQTPRTSMVSGTSSPSPAPWTTVNGRPWTSADLSGDYLPPRESGGQWAEQ
jgi:hypothetical protein